MIQYGVAVLAKDMPFPADCALSWIIWVAPFGRAVKRSSAVLRLLARTRHYRRGAPGDFLCPLGATASRLAEPINITLTEYLGYSLMFTARLADARVFAISMAMVIGPTPPGTGVMAPATLLTSSKSTSPASFVFVSPPSLT